MVRDPGIDRALVNHTRTNGGRGSRSARTVVRPGDDRGFEGRRTQGDRGRISIRSDHALGVVDGLITGWHERRSRPTLDLLEAVAGRRLLAESYRNALDQGYLWHEFGDSHHPARLERR